MGTHVLVPLDHSTQSTAALEHAATTFPDASITLLHVLTPTDATHSSPFVAASASNWYEQAKDEADTLFDDATATLADTAIDPDTDLTTVTKTGRPAATIINYAETNDIDHIVMGSHGRSGVSRILIGSVAEVVVRRSTIPVTVVR